MAHKGQEIGFHLEQFDRIRVSLKCFQKFKVCDLNNGVFSKDHKILH